jgi:hypothetical protein
VKDRNFDVLSRRAAEAVSRRGSFRVLGGAALASVLARPGGTRAGKATKKARKKCKQQKVGCEEYVVAAYSNCETCRNALFPCCALLGQCQGREATKCLLSG